MHSQQPPDGPFGKSTTARSDLRRLVELVARLRAPEGCPWDREQGLSDLRAYLLEEAHETAAAIDAGDWDALAGELGDLVFLAAFVARVAEESGGFTIEEVLDRAAAKIVERHPHVFGGERLPDADSVRRAWESRKAREARQVEPDRSHLAGVPASLPALLAAYRLSQKAAGIGFDWPQAEAVLAKVDEEIAELRTALAPDGGRQAVFEEVGDLLFTVANLARKLGLDPEAALAAANRKFRRRFAAVERRLADRGGSLESATREELERLWEAAKRGD
jgi:nucleoside triphosphate diphosphatase